MSSVDATLRMLLLGEDRSASKALKGVANETDKTSTKMEKFHKVGRAAGVALAGGLTLVAAGAIKATKAAAEDQLSSEKLAQTYHRAAGASQEAIDKTEEWITKQGKLKGVTDDELRPALTKLVVATHSVSKAQHLANLAMDVSAGTGKSLESVSAALAKAQNGNVTGLSRLGVATKDASGNTLSLQKITKNLADTYNGAASKAAQTTAGKQKILTTQMHELQEQIGYQLLPVMSDLVSILIKLVTWVSHNTTTVGVLITVVGSLVAITYAVSAATAAWMAITKIATAAQIVFTNAQWALNIAMEANPIGLVVIAIVALVAAIIIAYKHSKTFRDIVQGAFHAILAAARGVADFFTSKVPAAFHKVVNAASNVMSWVKGHWPLLLAILSGPFGLAVLAIAKNWGRIKDATSAVIAFIKGKFGDLVSFVQGIPGKLLGMVGAYLNAGKAIGSHIISGIFAGLKAIGGFAGDLAGSIKGAVNSALHLPFTIKGPGPLPDFTIPAFARGVTNFGGGLALVGERGPEIVGLPSGSSVYPNGTAPGGGQRSSLGGDESKRILEQILDALNSQELVTRVTGGQMEVVLARHKRIGKAGQPLAFES